MAEARFTRRDTEKGAEFIVTPASTKVAAIICAILFVFIVDAVFISLLTGAHHGPLATIALLCGIMGIPLLFWSMYSGDRKARRPVTILVNRECLRVGKQEFPVSDIAELALVAPDGKTVGSSGAIFAGGSGVAGGVALGAVAAVSAVGSVLSSIGEDVKAASCSVNLRRRGDSTPVGLVFGVTQRVGAALVEDLVACMR